MRVRIPRQAPQSSTSGPASLLVLTLVALTLALLAPAPPDLLGGFRPDRAAHGTTVRAVPLVDDAAGRALFTATDMTPGATQENCLTVTAAGPVAGDEVWLLARDVEGDLAQHLRLVVEAGTGGSPGRCAGFIGSVLFRGSLAELAAASAGANGVRTGWLPNARNERSFRITVDVADSDAAQGGSVRADLVWALLPAGAVPVAAPAAGAPAAPGPVPANLPDEQPAPQPAAATTPALLDPQPTPVLAAPGSTPFLPGPDPAAERTTVEQAVVDLLQFVRTVGEVAEGVARTSGFPLLLVLVLGAFLAVQHHVDRRDPKLALAPVHGDPHLTFDDPDDTYDRAGARAGERTERR